MPSVRLRTQRTQAARRTCNAFEQSGHASPRLCITMNMPI